MKLLLLAASALTLLPTQDVPGEVDGASSPARYASLDGPRVQDRAEGWSPSVPGGSAELPGTPPRATAPSSMGSTLPPVASAAVASRPAQATADGPGTGGSGNAGVVPEASATLPDGGEPPSVGAARLAAQVQELENRLTDVETANAQTEQALSEQSERSAEAAAQAEEVREARSLRMGMVSDAVSNLSRAVGSMQSTEPDGAAMSSAEASLREAAANADAYGSSREADLIRSAWTDLSAAQQVMEQENGPAAQAHLQSAVQNAQRALQAAQNWAP